MVKRIFRKYQELIAHTAAIRDFRKEIVGFANSLDFKTVTAMLVVDQPFDSPTFHIVDNTPKEYLAAYYEPAFIGIDPVMQHCKRSASPLAWSQVTYASHGFGMLWEHQARFGYTAGIALALHFPGGKHFFFGIDRDQPLSRDERTVVKITAEVAQFAKLAHGRAVDMFLSEGTEVNIPVLSSEEVSVLVFSGDGYSLAEIAEATRKNEKIVTQHIVSAMRKLRCSTKYEAVIKAMRLKLL